MKIIKKGKNLQNNPNWIGKIITCSKCDAKYKLNSDDIVYSRLQAVMGYDDFSIVRYVICENKTCHALIYIK